MQNRPMYSLKQPTQTKEEFVTTMAKRMVSYSIYIFTQIKVIDGNVDA